MRTVRGFVTGLWAHVRPAVEELVAHLLVTLLTILSLAVVEWLLGVLHLEHRHLPGTGVTLSDWMFCLDVIAVTLINAVGVYRALRVVLWGRHDG